MSIVPAGILGQQILPKDIRIVDTKSFSVIHPRNRPLVLDIIQDTIQSFRKGLTLIILWHGVRGGFVVLCCVVLMACVRNKYIRNEDHTRERERERERERMVRQYDPEQEWTEECELSTSFE